MKMKKCLNCKIYTFMDFCPNCNKKTINPIPPPFSPEDKYGKYRRELLKEKTNF